MTNLSKPSGNLIPDSPSERVSVSADGDVRIGGDVVGRDKIVIGYSVEQVSVLIAQLQREFQPRPFDGRCPYIGLDSFDETNAGWFFGRDTLVADLLARVTVARGVVVAGPSGCGKSSLLRAGLLVALKQGRLPGSQHWLYETLTPGRDPLDSLSRVASSLAKSLNAGQDIRSRGLTDPGILHQWAEIALGEKRDRRAVIVVDQFEETFTPVGREAERRAFLGLLLHAATVEAGRVTIIFSMRSDFVAACAAYPELNRLLNQQFLQVGALSPDDLVKAIASPAIEVGLRVEPELIQQIIVDMAHEPGALPLMQFALRDLFEAQQRAGGVIALTLSAYLAQGGLHKALERHADAEFQKLDEAERGIARVVFGGLVLVGRGTRETRRTALLTELVPAGTDSTQVSTVVQKLADARLLTTDERDQSRTVTIAHERLIDAWPWLHKLVNDNREVIAFQNQIVEDTQDWERHGRDSSYLYTGARLATAREQLAQKRLSLPERAQAFVQAAIEAENERRRREDSARIQELAKERRTAARLRARNRVITLVGIIAMLAAAGAVFFGIEVTRQKRLGLARTLAAQALNLFGERYDLGLLLSLEANYITQTAESRGSLLTGLEASPSLMTYLRDHRAAVDRVTFSPDGKTLASGSDDGTLILWDVSDPTTSHPLGMPMVGHTQAVLGLAFSPDGHTLASGSDDGTLILWDVATHQPPGPPLVGRPGWKPSLAFSPDGKTLASGTLPGTIMLWDVATRQLLSQPLTGYQAGVLRVTYSPNGNLLASGSDDGTIMFWDVSNPTAPKAIGGPVKGHTSWVLSVAFNRDGTLLASGSGDSTVRLWDVATGQPLGNPLAGHSTWVNSVAFSPDGATLVSGSDDHTILLWDVATRQPRGAALPGHSTGVRSVAFSPDGHALASGSRDGAIILWDVDVHQRLGSPLTGNTARVGTVAFSPNGQLLASGSDDGRIILWDAASARPFGEPLSDHGAHVRSVAFSPDGQRLASGGNDNVIRLWDTATGQPAGEPLAGHKGAVLSVAFSPDGKTLASASLDDTIIIWDLNTRQPVIPPLIGNPHIMDTGGVWSLAFSPDGRLLASGNREGGVILWDAHTYEQRGQLNGKHTAFVYSLTFSPDSKLLVSAGYDQQIVLWDANTLQSIAPDLVGHNAAVTSVAFSPDGTTLASSGRDKTIIVWDVATHQKLGQLLSNHLHDFWSLAFSADGNTLAAGGGKGTILLWDFSLESWKRRACQIVARNLTVAEWQFYLPGEPYHQTCPELP